MSKHCTLLREALAEHQAVYESQRKTMLAMAPAIAAAEKIAARRGIEEVLVVLDMPQVVLHMRNVRDLTKEVLPVLQDFAREGYQLKMGYRCAEIRSVDYEGPDRIRLTAWLTLAEGAACKYVKVGEKTVPTMELQCEGEKV